MKEGEKTVICRKILYIYIYIILLGRCERNLRFRFRLELCVGLQTPALPCLRAFFFDRFPRGSRSLGSALAGLRRVFSRARVSESRATHKHGDPELEGYSLGRGDTDVLFFSVLEYFLVVAPRRASCDRLHLKKKICSPRFDLSDLLKLPLSTDCLALRAAIGLFEPFGLALLGGCLPLPLSLRRTTAFSGCRAVLGTRSLHIPAIALLVVCNSARLLFSPVEWDEDCWGV